MSNINLVSGKSFDFENQLKKLKILRILAFTSLLIVTVISAIFFMLTLLMPIGSVKKEQEQTLLGISALHKKLVNVALVSERITNINNVIDNRKNYPIVTSEILSKLPEDLSLEVLEIDDKQLKISISGKSLLNINQFIDYFIMYSDKNDKIKGLVIDELIYEPSLTQYKIEFSTELIEK